MYYNINMGYATTNQQKTTEMKLTNGQFLKFVKIFHRQITPGEWLANFFGHGNLTLKFKKTKTLYFYYKNPQNHANC